MAFDRTNTGVLFINDRKREGSKDADRTGSINIDGVEYFLDGWLKDGTKGKFLSLSVKRKNKQAAPPEGQESRPAPQRPPVSKPRPPGSPPPPRDPEYGEDAPDIDSSF